MVNPQKRSASVCGLAKHADSIENRRQRFVEKTGCKEPSKELVSLHA